MFLFMIILLFCAILFYAYSNTKKPVFTRISLPICNDWEGQLRVLHLSDLHMENISVTPEQLYDQLKNEKIDIIALTGDYLDRARSIPKLALYLDVLNQLSPKFGIYAVFGNHDYVLKGQNFKRLEFLLLDKGCHVLRNESKSIFVDGKKVNIIGIDDYHTRRSDLELSFSSIDREAIHLVLTHDPNIVLKMKDYPYDYLLSGHFHGGQIHYPKAFHLKKMGKLPSMDMIKGLHYFEERAFYISEGLGQTGFNIRLRSKPEITMHTLTAK
ncbi:MAG TPA: metallophosphoesterase [Bacillota bacterium]|nr:metallophosphoesterase [Bacillota bacterium]